MDEADSLACSDNTINLLENQNDEALYVGSFLLYVLRRKVFLKLRWDITLENFVLIDGVIGIIVFVR